MDPKRFKAFLKKIGELEEFKQPEIAGEIVSLNEEQIRILVEDKEQICLERIKAVREFLSGRLVDKNEHVIPMVLACAIAQVPMVLLGPPGTAKSAAIHMLCEALGLREKRENINDYDQNMRKALLAQEKGEEGWEMHRDRLQKSDRRLFEYLVTRFTTPEEILGAANIDALLKMSLFYREGNGMLPQTEIAFLDEIFKANAAILNALLSIINERIYYNAGRAFNVSLLMVYGASNEAPDTDELGALYDRFPIRVLSEPVDDHKTGDLMQKSLEGAYDKAMAPTNGESVKPVELACVNDFRLLSRTCHVRYGGRNAVSDRNSPDSFSGKFTRLFNQLRGEFSISDRTPARLFLVSKALAMLENSPTLQPQHLSVFKHVAPSVESARVLQDIVNVAM